MVILNMEIHALGQKTAEKLTKLKLCSPFQAQYRRILSCRCAGDGMTPPQQYRGCQPLLMATRMSTNAQNFNAGGQDSRKGASLERSVVLANGMPRSSTNQDLHRKSEPAIDKPFNVQRQNLNNFLTTGKAPISTKIVEEDRSNADSTESLSSNKELDKDSTNQST